MLYWSGINVVGCPEMDAEHARLLEQIDRLHDAMIRGRGSATAIATLRDLADQEAAHFAREERLMQEAGYEGLEEHRGQHAEILRELAALQRGVEAGHLAIAYDTMEAMRRWVREHINRWDRAAADHIMKQRETGTRRDRYGASMVEPA